MVPDVDFSQGLGVRAVSAPRRRKTFLGGDPSHGDFFQSENGLPQKHAISDLKFIGFGSKQSYHLHIQPNIVFIVFETVHVAAYKPW